MVPPTGCHPGITNSSFQFIIHLLGVRADVLFASVLFPSVLLGMAQGSRQPGSTTMTMGAVEMPVHCPHVAHKLGSLGPWWLFPTTHNHILSGSTVSIETLL